MRPKTIEEQYKKQSQIEHILSRPDSYIGSTQRQTETMWIFQDGRMVQKEIEYVPGLFKIFDEVLVNAADNFQRDKTMTYIKVNFGNSISVRNDGLPIPVKIHKEHNIYVPELIFGVLLTGSNYDDEEKRVVGGRNGLGAKLANVYSLEFIVEICDGESYFKQTWTNNMGNKQIPVIKQMKSSPYVHIEFKPDYKRFRMKDLEPDTEALLVKRVYDIAGIYGDKLKIILNDQRIKLGSFQKYVDMYLPEGSIKIYDKDMTTERWEVVASYSPTQFQQVSFVNAINTYKGGTHVAHVTDKIVTELQNELQNNKKYKSIEVQKYQIKAALWVFINCLIDNPTFDSQTKENLTTRVSDFGGKPDEKFQVTEKFSKALLKTDILEAIVSQAKAKQDAKLNKHLKGTKAGRLHGIEKLDDANDAGKKNAELCTLILTEGDSAKSLAMAGIDVVGRDRYGVFPLKGKLLNVREASLKQILANEEIENLIKIIGLQKDKQYTDLKSLRYGSVMIMTDQDTDGSHIKGLIINFIHHFWPSLFKHRGFLKEFVTPLIKASKANQVIPFFTVQDFKKFAQSTDISGWKVKYYKGLGTSDDVEAQEYFKNLRFHQIEFRYAGDQDDEAIDLCFNKKKTNERKQWLANYDTELYVDHTQKELQYHDFVHKELIHFSMADNIRSIPSIMDGMKPGQRKVLFACFKRNLKDELKVVQLGGYVAEHTMYHHGDQSLQGTIIGMAQNFVGSNNINLLLPKGQFGSRAMGGKDHASARYISTSLSKITRFIFPEPDDHSLNYQEDDGEIVEPQYYVPIIPLCLVNGAEGIGTGWSTSVPNYNPREIVEQIRRRLNGEAFQELSPFYKFYDGIIEAGANKSFIIRGLVEANGETDIVTIKELPIKKWTKNYKEWLDKEIQEEGSDIRDVREFHTKYKIHFELQMSDGFCGRNLDLHDYFKLNTTFQTSNLVLFNHEGKITKYESVVQIMEEFFKVRLQFYQLRKSYLLSKLDREVDILANKVRFIQMVVEEKVSLRNVKKKALVKQLDQFKFTRFSQLTQVRSTKVKAFGDKSNKQKAEESEEESAEVSKKMKGIEQDEADVSEFNYLLQMPLFSLTYEKIEKLTAERDSRLQQRDGLQNKSIESMWMEDLDQFLEILEQVEASEAQIVNSGEKKAGKPMKKNAKKKQNDKQNDKQNEKPNDKNNELNEEKQPKKAKGGGAKQAKETQNEKDKLKLKRKVEESQMRVEPQPEVAPLEVRLQQRLANEPEKLSQLSQIGDRKIRKLKQVDSDDDFQP